jgi:O-antigen/teichoic acid export membrane protein
LGIIQKQAIKGTLFIYVGVLIGFATAGVIFPRVLEASQIGLLSVMVSYSLIFAQLSTLGFISTTTRMFSYFRDEKTKHHGFLFIAIMVTTVGVLLILFIFFLIKPYLVTKSLEQSPLLAEYINAIIPLIIVTVYFSILDHYFKVLYNAVIGIFLKEFLQRILILVAILLYFFQVFSFHQFVVAYISCFAVPTLVIILALIKAGHFSLKPQLNFFTKDLVKTMVGMSLFGIIGSATGVITFNIDRIMIDDILGLASTGIYTTAFFYGTLVILPSRSLLKIASPIIADAWKEKDTGTLKTIYYKSSLNQLVIGLFILIGIWANIDNVFKILPAEFEAGRYVILLIGLAYLFDMALGVNASIIGNSKYYPAGALIMVFMVILIIITNLIFIPKYGIVGAAFASVLSKFIVNLVRYLFVLWKFKMQPYNYKFIIAILIGCVSYLAGYFMPEMKHFVLDIFIRSLLITILFGGLILLFRVSDDINRLFAGIINRARVIYRRLPHD